MTSICYSSLVTVKARDIRVFVSQNQHLLVCNEPHSKYRKEKRGISILFFSIVAVSKVKTELLYDPAIPLLNICPEKTIIQKDTGTPMFTAALFTTASTWKQPKCPSTDEWIKEIRCIYTTDYDSAIKRSETGSFVETWLDLESVIQREGSQKEKNKYCILMHIYEIWGNGTDEPICRARIETQT